MPQISCKDLVLSYERRVVINGLSFDVNEGDYLCIVGENGSGKSTLAKALLGLKSPSAGSIVRDDALRRSGIGYLPQQTELRRDFPASVGEVIISGRVAALGRRLFYGRADVKAARAAAEKLGILPLFGRPFPALSGGQRQRVLLARALCAGGGMILLDEPATGLDTVSASEMYSVTDEINRSGTTVIMISHDIPCAVRHARSILHLGNGDYFYGSTRDYLTSPDAGRFRAVSGI